MTTHETLEAKIDQLFAEWNKPDSPGAALVIVREGEVIYEHGYGAENLVQLQPISDFS